MKEYLNLGSVQDPSFDVKDFLTSSFERIAEIHKDNPAKQKEKMLLCIFSVLNYYELDKVVTLFEEAEKQDIQQFTKDMAYAANTIDAHMDMDLLVSNKLASLGYQEATDIFDNCTKKYC